MIENQGRASQNTSFFRPSRHRFSEAIAIFALLLLVGTFQSLDAFPGKIKYQIRFDEAQVITLAFAEEGQRLITGHADGTLAVRDASTGQAVRSFRAHKGRVYQLAAQINGSLLATGTLGKDAIKLWDAKSGELIASLSTYDETFGLAFSEDGAYLVCSGASGGFTTLDLWDLRSKKLIRTLGRFRVDDFVPGRILFSRDSARIIVSAQNRLHGIHIWAVAGQKLKTIPYNDDIISMSLHRNDTIAVGGTFGSKVVVFDLNSGQVLRTMSGHKGHITSVAAVDENHSISVSYKKDPTGPFIIWDIRTGQKVGTAKEEIASVSEVAVNPANGNIALALTTFGNLGNPTTLVVYGD
ncbi:MAG: hypothetical protein KDK23_09245 [Leptospiraceae bacterium]|nr:hypothetical protein [Leptospiraceae bacterium]